MKKENIDHARTLVEKINSIDSLIKKLKSATRWGFKTRKVGVYIQHKQKYFLSETSWGYYDNNGEETYTIENEAFLTDFLELLEKHKKLMEEALEEL